MSKRTVSRGQLPYAPKAPWGYRMRDLVRPTAAIVVLALSTSAEAANFDCSWATAASGTWNGAANWTSCNGAIPNNGADTFNANITAAGAAYTVTLNTAATIGSLTLNSTDATLSHTTGTLTAAAIDINNGTYNLAGGTIAGATIGGSGGVFRATANSTLSGATLSRSLDVGSPSSNIALTINGGLTLDHAVGEALTVFNQNNGFNTTNGLAFNTGTLGGTGTVVLTPGATMGLRLFINNGQTLTVGSGVTVKTNSVAASSGTAITTGSNGTLINQGTISSETAGRTLTVNPTTTTNTGTLAAKNGAILTLGGAWNNSAGTISLDANANSTVNLGGSFTTAQIGTLSRGAGGLNGQVNITGTLTNTGDTLLLDDSTGSLNLDGGSIVGGIIDNAAGSASKLNITASSTLSGGVTLASNLDVGSPSSNITLTVNGGLTLDHAVGEALTVFNQNNGFNTTNGLAFNTGTLGGTGTVVLTPGATMGLRLFINNGQTLTVGSGVTVKTNSVAASSGTAITTGSNGTLINQGTISSETAGRTLTVNPTTTTNTGTLAAKNGAILTLGGAWNNSAGTISLDANANSTVNLGGSFTTAQIGTLSRGAGGLNGQVNITGTLTNTGDTLLLDDSTGSLNLDGGSIVGGIIDNAAGSASKLNITASSTLSGGVTLASNLDVGSPSSNITLTVNGGLTLDHAVGEALTVFNQNNGFNTTNGLAFNTGTLGGTGTVVLTPGATMGLRLFINNGQTLTVGSGVTVKTNSVAASSGTAITTGSNGTLINQGTISSESAGRTLTVNPTTTTNTGTLAAKNGAILTLGGAWNNSAGTISLDANANSTVNLGGSFTTAQIGTLSRGAGGLNGRVNITGTLTNTGDTLLLDDSTGSLNLDGGTIVGGIIDTAAGSASKLNVTASSTLSGGVTLASNLAVGSPSSNVFLTINGGLTLDQAADEALTVFSQNGAFTVHDALRFNTGTLGGTGTVVLTPGTNASLLRMLVNNNQTLTIGSGVTIKTNSVATNSSTGITGSGGTLINQGTLSSESAGRTLTINPSNFTNTGTVAVKNGATATLGGAWDNSAGTFSLDANANSTLNLGGAFTTNQIGTLSRGVGGLNGQVNITGTLTNTGDTLLLDDTTGSLNLDGGTIVGGIIDTALGSASQLNVTASSTLSGGVTLASNLAVGSLSSGNVFLTINGGLTLDQAAGEALTVFSQTGGFTTHDALRFNTGTLGGTGTVVLTPGANAVNLRMLINGGQTLTVGSGVTIKTNSVATNSSTGITGSGGTLINQGTLSSESAGRTLTINPSNFTNTGTVAVKNGATATLGGAWDNSAGTFSLDANANSTLNLGGAFTTNQIGTLSRGVGGLNGQVNITGTLTNTGDTLLLDDTTGSLNLDGGTIVGGVIDTAAGSASKLNITDNSTLSGGVTLASNLAVGSPSSNVFLTINGGLTLDQAADEALTVFSQNGAFTVHDALRFNTGTLGGTGTVVLTPGTNASLLRMLVNNNQTLTIGSGVTIKTNSVATNSATAIHSTTNGTLINQGTLSSETAGRSFSVTTNAVTNTGTFSATNGASFVVGTNATNLTNLAANTLTGGTWKVGAGSTMNFGTATFANNAATIELDGVGSTFAAVNPLASNSGSFTIKNGRNFTTVGALANSGILAVGPSSTFTANGALTNDGQLQMGGGTAHANTTLTNNVAGQISGFGTISNTVLNHGLVRASGGNLNITGGIDGQSGTIQTDSGATLTLGADSDGDFLINNGTLDVGTHNVTVAQDYTNANFGSGNSFNARANVLGTGQILAGGDVAQALTGDVTGGGASYSMSFGNVHVGDISTKNFQIANTGATGPALRGAIQTSGNGANISDARLSGSGVTAADFGPLAAGASSGNFAVTFTATDAGVVGPQSIRVANNFDNVADTTLDIVSSAAYRLAAPGAHTPEPVNFGNRHVGDVVSQTLTLANNAVADGFSEALNASIGGATGAATSNGGSFNLLAAGASNNSALAVGLNTATAGAKSGTASITLVSDGTGTSGLGQTALAGQTVNVSGNVFRYADAGTVTPVPVNFGNHHVGDVVEQALTVSNVAVNDGFSEHLDASFGTIGGNLIASGSVNLLGAGGSNNSSMKLALNTTTAGAKSGSAVINFQSNGSATSGLGITALVGTPGTVNEQQTINADGAVFRLASASAHTPEPVVLANARVGGSSSQALTLSNTAVNDGFSERLNATIGGASAGLSASGSFSGLGAGASNNSALSVALNTSSAGHKAGTATITLTSDGAGTSELGQTAIGTQTVNVSGDVFRLASASAHSPEPVVLANARVGGVSSQTLSITNAATNDGFSERLNASIGGASAGITASGSFNLLGAGATNNSALSVSLDTASAGHKSGTATINLASDGAGTSGFSALALAGQTVNVSGDVFRLASASAHSPEPVNFGNRHVGDVVSQSLTLANSAAADGFSESLNASIGGATGAATSNGGSFNLLAAGASNNSALIVGLDTATVGVKTGTATINLASDGTGTSGFGALAIGTQTVNVSGTVYRLAQANNVLGVNFGAVHVGDSVSQALTIQNVAAADGFSEGLDASFGGSSDARILTSGSITNLAAGGSNNASMSVGINTGAAGLVTGTTTLNFASNGADTSGLGITALDSQVINVDAVISEAAVFRLASPVIQNAQPINFGKFRVGDVVSNVALSVLNDVPADGFSEALDASAAGASSGFSVAGGFNLLGAGETDTTGVTVGMSTASAGHQVGTASVAFNSNGEGSSGLGITSLGSQNVALTGDVYRLASASIASNVNLGNVHVGGSLGQALAITNTAAADGFSESLNASVAGANNGASASGAVNLLAAGAASNAINVALDASTVGAKNGTVSIALASDGTGTSDFAALAIGGHDVTLTGNVFGFAEASLSTQTMNFAAKRVGDAAENQNVTVANIAAADGFHEGLDANFGAAPAGFTTGGNTAISNLVAGGSASANLSLSTATAGNFSGNVDVAMTSNGTLSGLGNTALASQSIAVNGRVYAQAVANVDGAPINFGIVHKGDVVTARNIAVANDASGALTDVLQASVSANSAFGGTSGNLGAGLAAGAADSSSLNVALDTSVAGVFNGTALVALSSHNADMSDLSLAPALVALSAQVNEFANPLLARTGGDGSFDILGDSVTLDFGTLAQNSGSFTALLALSNNISGSADDLRFEFSGSSSNFGVNGFGAATLAAGDAHNLSVVLDTLVSGNFQDVFTLNLFSTNASGFDLQIGSLSVTLKGVVTPAAVPVPGAVWMLGSALAGLAGMRRRKVRGQI